MPTDVRYAPTSDQNIAGPRLARADVHRTDATCSHGINDAAQLFSVPFLFERIVIKSKQR